MTRPPRRLPNRIRERFEMHVLPFFSRQLMAP
jgi:hypothetical protein